MNDLPIVKFAGKKIKPTEAGVYLCPFGCGSAGYPRPKWKTAAEFKKHLSKCPKSPFVLKEYLLLDSTQMDNADEQMTESAPGKRANACNANRLML